MVKLIDVYPGRLPRSGPEPDRRADGRLSAARARRAFRGKFRNSFEKPEPFEPGEADDGEVHAAGRAATRSGPGHRIMVQVQSTWFPLVDRNPQTFCDIYTAKEKDFQKATHRVYRDCGHPSKVTVRVLK